jgi:hypothetical protein
MNLLTLTGLSPSLALLSNSLHLQIIIRDGRPTTPNLPKQFRFGLLPVRSPLLGESLLFSIPSGT